MVTIALISLIKSHTNCHDNTLYNFSKPMQLEKYQWVSLFQIGTSMTVFGPFRQDCSLPSIDMKTYWL